MQTRPRTLRLSVVIPHRNGAQTLARCLEAVRNSQTPLYECIVVDDGSSDESAAVAESAGAMVLHTHGTNGPAAARNLGAFSASGDVVVFIDSDVCVNSQTLRLIRARFENDPSLDALMGSYDDDPAGRGLVTQYKNLLHHYVHQHGNSEATTFWSGCGAIRREVFTALGGFDESYTRPCIEDIELGYRLRQRGHRIALDPAVQVKHLKSYRLLTWLRSDIFDRALPWTRLILYSGSLPNDLNLQLSQRASAALVLLSVLLVPLCLLESVSPALAMVPLLGSVVLNQRFYRFLGAKRGWRLAAGAVALHSAYYLYSSIAFAAGAILYMPLWGHAREAAPRSLRARKPATLMAPPIVIEFESKAK